MSGKGKSQAIRAKLSHPVIDSDGHWREYGPLALDCLRAEAGPKLVEKWNSRVRHFGESSFAKLDAQGRRAQRIGQQPWWALVSPSELDTATAFLPRLLHERLPEMVFTSLPGPKEEDGCEHREHAGWVSQHLAV